MTRRVFTRRRLGYAGLIGLGICAVPLAAPGGDLVPAAPYARPDWVEGIYGGGVGISPSAYYAFMWVALGCWLAVIAGAPALPARTLGLTIVALVAAFALAPPLLSQDVFSYISYARLGTEHGLNPYSETPSEVPTDEAFRFVGWPVDVSAYGPAFTLLSYPLGLVGVAVALWTAKAVFALATLALVATVARLAAWRGVDPRFAAAFVALNPLVLVHVVGGAHNDGLMMLLVMLGCAAVLARREAAGGATLIMAVATKVSAAVAAPFALAGCASRSRLVAGGAAALAAVVGASLAAFGTDGLGSLALVGENQELTSHFSFPATAARAAGVDTETARVIALVLLGLVMIALLAWTLRGGDWLRAAGWAVAVLLLATAWLLPWYVVWLLPLAALSRDRGLALVAVALTAWQLGVRVPL